MNKKIIALLLLYFSFTKLFAAKMAITPFIIYENAGKKINFDHNPAETIFIELEQYWFEGLLGFSYFSEKNYGLVYTLMDANATCSAENQDYLLYGFVQKNETNWFADVKLYDASKKKLIKEFYSSDDIEHYNRFIENLIRNIIDGLLDITGLSKEEKIKEEQRPMELKLPVSAYYWSPINEKWNRKIIGTAGIKIGADFYPSQKKKIFNSKLIDISIMPKFEWNYGLNHKDVYKLSLNTISIGAPLLFHIHFDNIHTVYTGAGFNYEIELMSIVPKYEEKKFLYQNIFSVEITAGYDFHLNELLELIAETTFDFHLGKSEFVSIKPALGVSFNLFKGRN